MHVATEEQLGYRDAIRQIRRALERRLHHLEENRPQSQTSKESLNELSVRIDEIRHMIDVIESLHR